MRREGLAGGGAGEEGVEVGEALGGEGGPYLRELYGQEGRRGGRRIRYGVPDGEPIRGPVNDGNDTQGKNNPPRVGHLSPVN